MKFRVRLESLSPGQKFRLVGDPIVYTKDKDSCSEESVHATNQFGGGACLCSSVMVYPIGGFNGSA